MCCQMRSCGVQPIAPKPHFSTVGAPIKIFSFLQRLSSLSCVKLFYSCSLTFADAWYSAGVLSVPLLLYPSFPSCSLSLSLSPLSPLSPLTLLLHHASIPPYPVPPTPPPLPQYFLTTSLVSHRSSIPYSWTMSTVTHLCLENHHKSSSKQH